MSNNYNLRKIKRSLRTLSLEIVEYMPRNSSYSITYDEFGVSEYSLTDINNLPEIIEMGDAIVRHIKSNYSPSWNNFGYVFREHAENMEKEIEFLRPISQEIENNEQELDLDEILNNFISPNILPDGIDYRKYNDLFEKLLIPRKMFEYIFITENILRDFMERELNSAGKTDITQFGNINIQKKVVSRKNDELAHNYLPVRGSSDIYYLDLSELINIIIINWNSEFASKFPSQRWIVERISSLYKIRCRVAHNSGTLTEDELGAVKTYCREIIRQIDPNIP